MEQALDVKALAHILNLSVSTVYYHLGRSDGELPPGFKVGKHHRWNPETVRLWLQRKDAYARKVLA